MFGTGRRAEACAGSRMPKPKDHQLLAKLGTKFREIRVMNGWTQEGLAEALSIQSATISRWERGRSGLSFPVLAQAAELFGIGLGELLAIEGAYIPPASG